MNGIMVFALVTGVVVIPWTYFFIAFGFPLWASFLGAAIFFACGGGKEGLVKALPASSLGVLFAAGVSIAAASVPAGGLVFLSFVCGIAAFLIVLLSTVGIFGSVPSTFVGFATTFAVMTVFPKIGMIQQLIYAILAMAAGMLISYLIQLINSAITSKLICANKSSAT